MKKKIIIILSITFLFLISLFISISYINFKNQLKEKNEEIEALKTESKFSDLYYENLISQKEEEIEEIKNNYNEYFTDNESMSKDIVELTSALIILNNSQKEVLDKNQILYKDNLSLAERLSKYEHYDFALINTEGERNQLTYENLVFLEELTNNKIITPEYLLAVIMVESEGSYTCPNPNSTAKGLAQFLDGTSKWVWTDMLDKDPSEWYPTIVYNPEICLEMMVAYVEYLINSTNGDLYKVLDRYRGLHDTPYINKINKYLNKGGTSLEEQAKIVKDRYLKSRE